MEEREVTKDRSEEVIGFGCIVALLGIGYFVGNRHGKKIGTLTAVNEAQSTLIKVLSEKSKKED